MKPNSKKTQKRSQDPIKRTDIDLSREDFDLLNSKEDILNQLHRRGRDLTKVNSTLEYLEELKFLQIELVKLQHWIAKNKLRVAVIFEGRDAAGKGGSIRRFTEHLNPRSTRTVALNKPTLVEQGQWYFERYIKELPNPGEFVFFDRSWYNRAVVEPVMGFCTQEQYQVFMNQLPDFEHMLFEDGVIIIKFWLSISKDVQVKRFQDRIDNPLKRWKYSPVDARGQEMWDEYTHYKNRMFIGTHTTYSPWMIVNANDKKRARLESMRYVLSKFEYEGKSDENIMLSPDPNIVSRYFRSASHQD